MDLSPFKFQRKHQSYFSQCLRLLPSDYTSIDTNRITVAFFCLSALDVLDELETVVTREQRQAYIAWIYGLQVWKNVAGPEVTAGFRGSPALRLSPEDTSISTCRYDAPNLAMTYTALACLLLLGDDLARVDRDAIVQGLRPLQQANGSFVPVWGSTEADVRFLYCACAISYILNCWDGVNQDQAVAYIRSSVSYDGGIGQGPGLESHGGSTYCALASLHLMGREDVLEELGPRTLHWCMHRHIGGFQGRTEKPADTCYTFWIGACLQILGQQTLVDPEPVKLFLESTASEYGGYGKEAEDFPDALHSYMGLAGMSVLGMRPKELLPVDGALNLTQRTVAFLMSNTRWHRQGT